MHASWTLPFPTPAFSLGDTGGAANGLALGSTQRQRRPCEPNPCTAPQTRTYHPTILRLPREFGVARRAAADRQLWDAWDRRNLPRSDHRPNRGVRSVAEPNY